MEFNDNALIGHGFNASGPHVLVYQQHVVCFDNWRTTSSGEWLGRLPVDVDAEW